MAAYRHQPIFKKRTPRPAPQAAKPAKKKPVPWRLVIVALLCVLSLAFCLFVFLRLKAGMSRGPAVFQAQRARILPAAARPEIISAVIQPEAPTATTGLSVQYEFASAEDQQVSFNFRWFVNDAIIAEEPSGSINPGLYRKGESVSVEVIPSDSRGPGKSLRSAARTIGDLPPVITEIALAPDKAFPGDVITPRITAQDPDGDTISYSYRWYLNAEPVPGPAGEARTFDTKGLRKKDTISLVVTPSDGEKTGKQALALGVTLFNSPPKITSTPPKGFTDDNRFYIYQMAATDPDGDRLTYSLEKAPEGMTIDSATGLIRWELPRNFSERREVPIKIKVDDGDGGVTSQEYSFFLEPVSL